MSLCPRHGDALQSSSAFWQVSLQWDWRMSQMQRTHCLRELMKHIITPKHQELLMPKTVKYQWTEGTWLSAQSRVKEAPSGNCRPEYLEPAPLFRTFVNLKTNMWRKNKCPMMTWWGGKERNFGVNSWRSCVQFAFILALAILLVYSWLSKVS